MICLISVIWLFVAMCREIGERKEDWAGCMIKPNRIPILTQWIRKISTLQKWIFKIIHYYPISSLSLSFFFWKYSLCATCLSYFPFLAIFYYYPIIPISPLSFLFLQIFIMCHMFIIFFFFDDFPWFSDIYLFIPEQPPRARLDLPECRGGGNARLARTKTWL